MRQQNRQQRFDGDTVNRNTTRNQRAPEYRQDDQSSIVRQKSGEFQEVQNQKEERNNFQQRQQNDNKNSRRQSDREQYEDAVQQDQEHRSDATKSHPPSGWNDWQWNTGSDEIRGDGRPVHRFEGKAQWTRKPQNRGRFHTQQQNETMADNFRDNYPQNRFVSDHQTSNAKKRRQTDESGKHSARNVLEKGDNLVMQVKNSDNVVVDNVVQAIVDEKVAQQTSQNDGDVTVERKVVAEKHETEKGHVASSNVSKRNIGFRVGRSHTKGYVRRTTTGRRMGGAKLKVSNVKSDALAADDEQAEVSDDNDATIDKSAEEKEVHQKSKDSKSEGEINESLPNDEDTDEDEESLQKFIKENTLKLDVEIAAMAGLNLEDQEVTSPELSMKTPVGHEHVADWGAAVEAAESTARENKVENVVDNKSATEEVKNKPEVKSDVEAEGSSLKHDHVTDSSEGKVDRVNTNCINEAITEEKEKTESSRNIENDDKNNEKEEKFATSSSPEEAGKVLSSLDNITENNVQPIQNTNPVASIHSETINKSTDISAPQEETKELLNEQKETIILIKNENTEQNDTKITSATPTELNDDVSPEKIAAEINVSQNQKDSDKSNTNTD